MIKIYGKNAIYETIKANKASYLEVFVCAKEVSKNNNFIKLLEDKNVKYNVVDSKKLDSMFGFMHQGYGALRNEYEYKDLSILNDNSKRQLVLVLDGITDPHNFGAILRSCDAFGVAAVIIPKNRSVSVNSTVAKVSTGAIEYVDVIMVNNLNNAIRSLKDKGFWIVGTDASGDKVAKDIDKSLSLAVIVGSEGFGMSKIVKKECDYLLKIPMKGHVNSLNASVSAGIVLNLLTNE